jgi:type VI secretion system protein ImpI
MVQLQQGEYNLPDPTRHLSEHSVDEILNARRANLLDGLPAADEQEPSWGIQDDAQHPLQHPLNQPMLDPLQALDAVQPTQKTSMSTPLDSRHYGISPAITPQDFAGTRFEALAGLPKPHFGDNPMPQHDASTTPPQVWRNQRDTYASDSSDQAAPLIEGLGIPPGSLDAPTSYQLLYETGQALGALIRGLSALHQSQPASEPGSLSLHGRTLQPIEDNPLRLGLDYAETVQALFSRQRSLVHLTPQAAVEESLSQMQQHHQAVIQGIAAGLAALLQTFSPQQLLERFRRYQPEQASSPQQAEWAWCMYTHYYDELTSGRQKGFEKLFWEVFSQHYDKAMREGKS